MKRDEPLSLEDRYVYCLVLLRARFVSYSSISTDRTYCFLLLFLSSKTCENCSLNIVVEEETFLKIFYRLLFRQQTHRERCQNIYEKHA